MRGVHRERHRVRARELLRLEDAERHHRVRDARLDEQERDERERPRRTPSDDGDDGPVVTGTLDQRVHHAREPHREQHAPGEVEVRAGVLVARLGHVPQRDAGSRRREIGRLMTNTHRHDTESMR